MTSVRVIGCGNLESGDDALGRIAVRAARSRLPEDVEVVEAGSGTQVIDLVQDVDGVVIVDAVLLPASLRANGTPIRLDVSSGQVPSGVRTSLSSHGIGLLEALMLAAAVGPLPRIVILGLQAHNTEVFTGLSPEVAEGLDALVRDVVDEVSAMRSVPVP